MGRTVAELLETISAREFHDHYADWQRCQWGPEVDDMRHGVAMANSMNMAGKMLDKGVVKQPHEFMVTRRDREEQADALSFLAKIGAL